MLLIAHSPFSGFVDMRSMADDLFMISILPNEPCIELAGTQSFSNLD